jgi:hypothetical protein
LVGGVLSGQVLVGSRTMGRLAAAPVAVRTHSGCQRQRSLTLFY